VLDKQILSGRMRKKPFSVLSQRLKRCVFSNSVSGVNEGRRVSLGQEKMPGGGSVRPPETLSSIFLERFLDEFTVLDDGQNLLPVLENPDVLQGVSVHEDEVGAFPCLDGSRPVGQSHEFGVVPGSAEDGLHGAHDPGLQFDLEGLEGLSRADHVGARAYLQSFLEGDGEGVFRVFLHFLHFPEEVGGNAELLAP